MGWGAVSSSQCAVEAFVARCHPRDERVLEQLWRHLPAESSGGPNRMSMREAALALACGTHPTLGRESSIRALADIPEMVRLIAWHVAATPLVVPGDHESLQEAASRANSLQTIVIRPGIHSLIQGQHLPTRLEKHLHVVGMPGAVLVGGLHLGMDSSGIVKGVEVRGHLWVYDGRWEISGCKLINKDQDAAVVCSNNAHAHFKECEIGGLRHARSHHGLIQYGDSAVCLEACDVFFCRLAVALGKFRNQCRCFIVESDLKDCDVVFACMQGDTGIHLEVTECEIGRSGVVWKDGRRPPNVISRNNTVKRESVGHEYWTHNVPWGSWERITHPTQMIADGDLVIGDEEGLLADLNLHDSMGIEQEDLDPEAFDTEIDMDIS